MHRHRSLPRARAVTILGAFALAFAATLAAPLALAACTAEPAPADDEALGEISAPLQALGPPGHWQSIPIRRGFFGSATLLRTRDGGATWTSLPVPDGYFSDVAFADASTAGSWASRR